MAEPMLVDTLPRRLEAALAGGVGPYYLHRTRPWIGRAVLGLALLAATAAVAFVAIRVTQGPVGAAEWMLALFALPFVGLLLRPSAWQSPVSMVADARGLHFLHGRAGLERHSVAWHEVGAMRIERVAVGGGVTRSVVVRIRGDSAFWAETMASPFMRQWVQPVEADGYRRLPLPPVWTSTRGTLAALERLRSGARR